MKTMLKQAEMQRVIGGLGTSCHCHCKLNMIINGPGAPAGNLYLGIKKNWQYCENSCVAVGYVMDKCNLLV